MVVLTSHQNVDWMEGKSMHSVNSIQANLYIDFLCCIVIASSARQTREQSTMDVVMVD